MILFIFVIVYVKKDRFTDKRPMGHIAHLCDIGSLSSGDFKIFISVKMFTPYCCQKDHIITEINSYNIGIPQHLYDQHNFTVLVKPKVTYHPCYKIKNLAIRNLYKYNENCILHNSRNIDCVT